MDNQSLSHTKWNCIYHIVFIPKYRQKVMFGQLQCACLEQGYIFKKHTLNRQKNTGAHRHAKLYFTLQYCSC